VLEQADETAAAQGVDGPDPDAVMDALHLSRTARDRVRKRASKLRRQGRVASDREAELIALEEHVQRLDSQAAA
jgi:hypothetical protein